MNLFFSNIMVYFKEDNGPTPYVVGDEYGVKYIQLFDNFIKIVYSSSKCIIIPLTSITHFKGTER